jgi:glycosyltransferase involved in cell wall biosynthesis
MYEGKPSVSVVITSYNHKAYLIEAIESVIAQTVRPHEIIVADDASTDGSVDVIREYERKHPGWIKGVYHPRNVGIPRNRNAALRIVTGDYVAVLDGDDRYLPHRIERELEVLAAMPEARCVYSNVRVIDAEGRILELRDTEPQPSGDIFVYVASGTFGLMRSLLVDYELFRDVGFMDESFPKYDGFDLTVQLASRASFAYVEEPLTEYREHPASDSKSNTIAMRYRDLSGIYQKMQPLVAQRVPAEQGVIRAWWKRRLFQWHLQAAVEQEHIAVVLRLIVKGTFGRTGRWKDIRRAVAWLLPSPLVEWLRARRRDRTIAVH